MILLVLLLLLWRLLVVATFQYNFQSEHLYHNRCHNHYHYPPSSGWRRPRKSRNVFYRSLSSDEGTIPAVMNNSKAGYPILIRDCLNDDLSRVCDLIMESFYYNTCSSRSNHQTIWNNEFQKLQSTFQDMTTSERHSDRNQKQNYMLVAIATDDDDDYDVKNIGTVVGFVHVDNRPPLPNACLDQYVYFTDVDCKHVPLSYVSLLRIRFSLLVITFFACYDSCPRPILTDLMVCKSMQRKGIARRLVRFAC